MRMRCLGEVLGEDTVGEDHGAPQQTRDSATQRGPTGSRSRSEVAFKAAVGAGGGIADAQASSKPAAAIRSDGTSCGVVREDAAMEGSDKWASTPTFHLDRSTVRSQACDYVAFEDAVLHREAAVAFNVDRPAVAAAIRRLDEIVRNNAVGEGQGALAPMQHRPAIGVVRAHSSIFSEEAVGKHEVAAATVYASTPGESCHVVVEAAVGGGHGALTDSHPRAALGLIVGKDAVDQTEATPRGRHSTSCIVLKHALSDHETA